MQDIKLVRAGVKDIPVISALASLTWNQHYPEIIGQEQIDYMLGLMYSPEGLTEQLINKKHLFYLVMADDKAVGFISVCEQQKDNWYLNKFYIDQEQAGKGIGSSSFEQLISLINPRNISLQVNRGNFKSINFYFKLGFKISKTITVDIGDGFVMDDFVMTWRFKERC